MNTKTKTICTFCKEQPPIYKRAYSNEKLCKKCFIKNIQQKTAQTIAKYDMLTPNDHTAIALSGGKDSTTLLYILAKIEKKYPNTTLTAITIDEGIKNYRKEAIKIAQWNTKKLGIPHHVMSFKKLYGYTLDEIVGIVRKRKHLQLTPCAYCGALRRQALNMLAREVGATKLATAHTLDDEVQTILLNILHGDVARLAKVKPKSSVAHFKFVTRIKPFCQILEREVALYAFLKGFEFQATPCPYAPMALRSDVRVLLNRMEQKHAGVKFVVFRSVERLRSMLEGFVDGLRLGECRVCGEPCIGDLCKPCEMLQELRVL